MSEFDTLAKNFVAFNEVGVLSTMSQSNPGFPFGSLTPYVLDEGCPVIYISRIAEHFKNLSSEARSCLTVIDPFALLDPQAAARASLLLKFEALSDSYVPPIRAIYENRFPGAINYELTHDFVFLRGVPERVRWIGGFGKIGWISSQDFLNAKVDPLVPHGLEIVRHMNQDHRDSVEALARSRDSTIGRGYEVQMIWISSTGFKIRAQHQRTIKELDFTFHTPAKNPDEARKAMINEVQRVRSKSIQ